MSRIEWTDATWNPVTGCDRVSPGCANCYALTMARRLKAMGSPRYQRDGRPGTSGPGFGVTVHTDVLDEPLRWRRPRRVFVNSMSDLFHPEVPDSFIASVFDVMGATPQHTYQVLTKRPARMRQLLTAWGTGEVTWEGGASVAPVDPVHGTWPLPNVWLGVSAENQAQADKRIPDLVATPAAVRFVSAEPLLSALNLSRWLGVEYSDMGLWLAEFMAPVSGRSLLDWVIVGGESGPGARPMDPAWAADLVDQCQAGQTAVFVKQLGACWARDTVIGGRSVYAAGDHKGGDPTRWPAGLNVRQYPPAGA